MMPRFGGFGEEGTRYLFDIFVVLKECETEALPSLIKNRRKVVSKDVNKTCSTVPPSYVFQEPNSTFLA